MLDLSQLITLADIESFVQVLLIVGGEMPELYRHGPSVCAARFALAEKGVART